MKGGFNKLLRNIVASTTDTEYEKVRYYFELNFYIETNESNFPCRFKRTQRKTRYL